MQACLIAVGSEMLTPFRVDTNSLTVTDRLNAIGIDVRLKAVVGDDVHELADVLRAALGWADVVVVTGGLGPTDDDITREAVAVALDTPLDAHEWVIDQIRERFERRNLVMPEINRRQGLAPRGAVLLDNPMGTAPGLWIEHGRTVVVLLPGPPREMTPMLDAVVRDRLGARTLGSGLLRRVVKLTGRSESDVDTDAQPLYREWARAEVPIAATILAVLGQIELHLSARAFEGTAAARALDRAVSQLQLAFGRAIYSVDGQPLEAVVGGLLRAAHLRIATAESCTGGLLASRLTDIPGSSEYMDRGVICYSNEAKTDLLGVPPAVIAADGAVSEAVALAMAAGIRSRAGADIGVGITGIAGPGGGSTDKPVGTVVIAVTTPSGDAIRTFRFVGGRDMVKYQASQAAMNMVRLLLSSA